MPRKSASGLIVEDRDRLEPAFFQREVRDLGGLAAAVDRDAAIGGRAFLERRPQVLPDGAVEVERIVHELVGQARFFRRYHAV